MAILAIDAGTTGVTAVSVDASGQVLARGYQEFPQHFPRPGWVEHDPEEIWRATLAAVAQVLAQSSVALTAVGITNQRETAVLWRRGDLTPARRAIVWQDRRTTDLVERLRESGLEPLVHGRTGLWLDPYFTSSKLLWLAEREPELWDEVRAGRVAIGTVDSYLVCRMTGGTAHLTDVTNASRTQLFDLRAGDWDEELLEMFSVPRTALPTVRSSSEVVAHTEPGCFLGLGLPIAGIAGDQQSALFGHAAFATGDSKCTYGTGSFILTNTGATPQFSERGLLTTVAWRLEGQALTYATEGSVFATGAAVQWLRDGLGLIDSAAEVEALAAQVPDAGGVVFVPAFAGLGAPYWDPHARASFQGITRGTTAAHIARAVLESIAFSVKDVVDVMRAATGGRLGALRVDDGPSRNDLLMQLQADALGVSVHRSADPELTAVGAAYLAGLATGVWGGVAELGALGRPERVFEPSGQTLDYSAWRRAVERSLNWAG